MAYPTFTEIYSGSNPDRLFVIKRALVSLFPRCLLFIVSSILVLYVNITIGTPDNYGQFRWLGLLPLIVLLDLVRIYYNDVYIFSRFKLAKIEGRISFKYSVPTINYSDIRGIVVSQSFMGRILNYGDIYIGTASTEGHELIIKGVLAPNELAEIIEQFRENIESVIVRE